jgi:hypothetical protein
MWRAWCLSAWGPHAWDFSFFDVRGRGKKGRARAINQAPQVCVSLTMAECAFAGLHLKSAEQMQCWYEDKRAHDPDASACIFAFVQADWKAAFAAWIAVEPVVALAECVRQGCRCPPHDLAILVAKARMFCGGSLAHTAAWLPLLVNAAGTDLSSDASSDTAFTRRSWVEWMLVLGLGQRVQDARLLRHLTVAELDHVHEVCEWDAWQDEESESDCEYVSGFEFEEHHVDSGMALSVSSLRDTWRTAFA